MDARKQNQRYEQIEKTIIKVKCAEIAVTDDMI